MIFLDNASTTKVFDDVMAVYSKYSTDLFYNPSAPYISANNVKQDITMAEKRILKFINAPENSKIVFTSCATESNNMAIFSSLNKSFKKVLLSVGEHSSVYNLAQEIMNRGFECEFVKLKADGKVDEADLVSKMDSNVGLVAIMHVSNETGAINDIEHLVKVVKGINPNCHFHCDGVQAMCKINVNVKALGVDTYTFSGHKIHAPKGIAGLYVKGNILPYIIGGGQQNGLRSGTENVAGIMALDKAIQMAKVNENYKYVQSLNNLAREILKADTRIKINSSIDNSPYILSISAVGVNGATLVNMMDSDGVCLGIGSACSTKKSGNTTLEAMGKDKKEVLGSVRMSFSASNTANEVEFACKKLLDNYQRLSKISGR